MTITVEHLSLKVGQTDLVKAASFDLHPGHLTVLIGPNGAGKTSLLRGVLGLLSPAAGEVRLDDVSLHTLSARARARRIAYLPQGRELAWPNRVEDIVALGRFAHGGALGSLSDLDQSAVMQALAACDLEHLADRRADTLSGGEQARMHFARALAAQTPYLIADEPVAGLDPRQQLRTLDLIQRYTQNGGGALIVLHDLALAAKYADHLIWMQMGEIVAQGSVESTLNAARLSEVFGIECRVSERQIMILGPA